MKLRATRARLQEFLAKAPDINDMLTVERELERVAHDSRPLPPPDLRTVELPIPWLSEIGIDPHWKLPIPQRPIASSQRSVSIVPASCSHG